MTFLTVAACVGSGLLALVAALPCLGTAGRATTLATLVVSIGIGAAAVGWAFSAADYLPNTHASAIVRHGVEKLRRWNARSRSDLLVVEGGSYSSRALDPELLSKELATMGYDVEVVQMSLGAANHFERHQLFRDVFDRVQPRAADGKRHRDVVVLSEVHGVYDRKPLDQLQNNQDTNRSYHYMTASNAWLGLRAHAAVALHEGTFDLGEQAAMAWTVARHLLVNRFNVGLAARTASLWSVPAKSGFARKGISRGYRFAGMAEAVAAAEGPIEPGQTGPVLDWLVETREARLKDLWQHRFDRWVYFSAPSTRPRHTAWTRGFCSVAKEPCIPIDDPALLRALDGRRFWHDQGHLTTAGARVYTRWLARRLADNQTFKKRDPRAAETKPRTRARSTRKKRKREPSAPGAGQ